MTALALVLGLALQQDPGPWIEKLKSDDARERDAASRQLEALGPDVLPRLESVRSDDVELNARLKSVIAVIKTRAALAKVYGPTKRVTASFKNRRLDEVLRDLGTAIGEEFEGKGIDVGKTIDLELRDATLWQALDALAKSAGVRWEYDDKIKLNPGPPADLPTLYAEQFRVSIGEVKKVEFRDPHGPSTLGVVVIVVRYQRNLKPADQSSHEAIQVEELTDAAGKPQKVEEPVWASSWSMSGRLHTIAQSLTVNGAAGPLTIEGKTQVLFHLKRREISIPLEEGKRSFSLDDVKFEVAGFGETAATTFATLQIAAQETENLSGRLDGESVALIDGEGKRHPGTSRGGFGLPMSINREFAFPKGIRNPRRIVFQWTTEFHLVEIPFRFEGVRLPEIGK